MSRFTLSKTPLGGLMQVQRHPHADERGFLSRIFCSQDLEAAGWLGPIAQVNHTLTRRAGTVRGLHYQQSPHAETKLVSCLAGEVWDVAVDLRKGSPTFMHWHGVYLSADNAQALLIPRGFAHGFQAITSDAVMLYCHSEPFTPHAEAGVHVLDPVLSIRWPLPVADLSARDAAHPWVQSDFVGVPL